MEIRRGARSPTVEELRHIAQAGDTGLRELGTRYQLHLLVANGPWVGNLEELVDATASDPTLVRASLQGEQDRGWLVVTHERQPQGDYHFGEECRSVRLGKQTFAFSKYKAAAVRELRIALEHGTPDIEKYRLMELIESTSSFDNLFRGDPALGKLIVRGGSAGTVRLNISM